MDALPDLSRLRASGAKVGARGDPPPYDDIVDRLWVPGVMDPVADFEADALVSGPLVLQVTSPRRPCSKIDRAFGEMWNGQGVRAHCAKSGRAGIMCRVLSPGALPAARRAPSAGGIIFLAPWRGGPSEMAQTLAARHGDRISPRPRPWGL